MAKRIVQMHDKHKSTTNIYPKVTMGSLSPQVKAYIEGQGDDKYVKRVNIKSEDITTTVNNGGNYFEAYINDTEYDMYGDFKVAIEEAYWKLSQGGSDESTVVLGNAGEFKVQFTNQEIPELNHELTFDNEGNLKVDGQAVGGGSQLYLHNIVYYDSTNGRTFTAQIINDSNEQINTRQKMINYLLDNDLTSFRKSLMVNGKWSTNQYNYQGLYYDNGEYPHIKVWYGNGTSYTAETWELPSEEYNDTVITL